MERHRPGHLGMAAGWLAPNRAPPGKTLKLNLPEVPVRPLIAYALERVR